MGDCGEASVFRSRSGLVAWLPEWIKWTPGELHFILQINFHSLKQQPLFEHFALLVPGTCNTVIIDHLPQKPGNTTSAI